jgi:hypothetical protein
VISHRFGYLEIYLFLGFCPSALASLLLFCCQKDDYFSPLANCCLFFVCLFVTKTERTPELLTNAKREKENNKKE